MMATIVNSDKPSDISVFRNIEEMSGALFNLLADEFSFALSEKRTYHLALSGGSTPVNIFEHLSRLPIARMKWNFLHIYWGDERCVPPDNPESNFGNMWNAILKNINIPEENIHRIHGENEAESESKNYSEVLRQYIPLVNGFPKFDLTLLGIGEDGHTASIFPGSLEFLDYNEFCHVTTYPKTKRKRISISLKVINNSRCILFLASGASKAEILSTVINKKNGYEMLPSSYVKPVEGELKWFLDIEAAKNL
jgi:6-phosphogluconolactonase